MTHASSLQDIKIPVIFPSAFVNQVGLFDRYRAFIWLAGCKSIKSWYPPSQRDELYVLNGLCLFPLTDFRGLPHLLNNISGTTWNFSQYI